MANIHAAQAWDVTTGDASLVVADIDTGIDRSHPDLAANMWTNPGEIEGNGIDDDGNGYVDDIHGWDRAYGDNDPMDVHGHGTHTSGTVGAVGNNGVGVAGVNWNVKLMALKFLNDSGSGSTSNAIAALNYAIAKGVKVSNNSWGGGSYSQSLYDAINNARLANHIFVAAAGNGGSDQRGDNNDVIPHYPSSYNLHNIIAVAAITSSDALASYSNYGPSSVDLAAPGSSILSTTPNNSYAYYSGTSMATPHVSGVVALLYAIYPDWTHSQVRDQIFQTVRPLSVLSGKVVTGGTLDAGAALAGGTPPPTATPTAEPTATPTALPTATPTALPTATPVPSGSMHVGDLDGSSASNRNRWQASVTILVDDQDGQHVANAQVTGSWSTGATSTCTTGTDGRCTTTLGGLKRTVSSVTFTVDGVSHATLGYKPTANTDLDGDSDGTSIIVSQ